MKFFNSLHQKILLLFAFWATITLIGFFAVYFITLDQQLSLEKYSEIPYFSINLFQLNNGILKSTRAQQSYFKSGNKKFLQDVNIAWDKEINPAFSQLGKLYKKSRVWTSEREVERRAFYDLRLMILDLKNIQQKSLNVYQVEISEKFLKAWTKNEWPLVQKIIKQIEFLVRWQTDYAKQKSSELQNDFSRLGIWIWLIATIVLVLLLIIALIFAKKISAPLKKLRSEVNKVIVEQNISKIGSKLSANEFKDEFLTNEDEVKKLTESFKKMELAIRQRTELLETSNRQLDESNRAKGTYLTNMSHELRTPLNAIIGFTEVLIKTGNEDSLSDYRKDRLNRILKSGKHLLKLINSLLDLSKIESGQMGIEKKEFQLKILLKDVMEWLEPLFFEKSIKYDLFLETKDQLIVYSDAAKVRQILINLIGNAIKFTGPKGQIEIKVSQIENDFIVSIKDSGCGINDEQQEKIFNIFHQVKSSNQPEVNKGTGLGLTLVKSIVELLGGSITLKSKIGKGSTFTIRLPLK